MKKELIIASSAAVIGAVSALLLAPKKGSEIRNDIKSTYATVSDKTVETVSSLKQRMRETRKKVDTDAVEPEATTESDDIEVSVITNNVQ